MTNQRTTVNQRTKPWAASTRLMSVLFAAAAICTGDPAAGQPTAPAAVDRSATVAEMEQGLPENSRVWLVDQGYPRADDAGAGTAAAPLRTIQAAAEQAEPGDLVLVGEGTYRERVAPVRGGSQDRPIIYQAVPGERVEVKGSDLWTSPWSADAEHDRVFSSPIPREPFAEIPSPYRIGGTRCKTAPS